MKTKIFILGLLAFAIPSSVFALEPPVLDELPDAVDAATIAITGTATPGAKITVIGGPTEIPPALVKEDGTFIIKTGLIQESDNIFSITTSKDGEVSESIMIVVTESKEAAAEYGRTYGKDVIAPDAPEIDPYTSPVNTDILLLTGTAESGATIAAFKTDETILAETTAKKDGSFTICVSLNQESTNYVNITATDASGNVSVIVQKKIEEKETGTIIHVDTRKCVTHKKEAREIAPPFKDIENHWGAPYIEKLRVKGIITGKKPGIFNPNDRVSRAEIVKIALRAFYNIGEDLTQPEKTPFDDVPLHIWYTPYVTKAKELNLITGYENNTFGPDSEITRAEALKILLSASQLTIEAKRSYYFPDIDVKAWYSKYIAYAQDKNIVGGYQDGNFRPHYSVTRAEISKITAIIIDVIEEEKKNKVTEIPDRPTTDDTVTETPESPDAISDTPPDDTPYTAPEDSQTYSNEFFKFEFVYNKNWYFNWPGAADDALGSIYLSEKDPTDETYSIETDALTTVNILKQTLDDVGLLDGAEVTEDGTYSIYKALNDESHIEITADEKYKDEVERIAESLTITE